MINRLKIFGQLLDNILKMIYTAFNYDCLFI